MSNLAKNLNSVLLEKKKPQENEAGVLSVTTAYETHMMPIHTTYKMVATIGCVFLVDDWEAAHADPTLRANRELEAREKIISVVFGEFRQPLLKAKRYAIAGDAYKACQAIDAVLDSMFSLD